MAETKYSAPAVERALEIIELLSMTEVGLTVTMIANQLDVSVNSTFRILKELEKKNYVVKDTADTSYKLSAKLYYLGMRVGDKDILLTEIEPFMKSLAIDTCETILFAKLTESFGTLIIKQIQSSQPIKFLSQVGEAYDSYCSAMGKCLLAFQEPLSVERYIANTEFEAKTSSTIVDKEVFQKELAQIRHDGYAMDFEESVKGLVCIACPVFSAGGCIEGAICISGVGFRMTERNREQYLTLLRRSAKGISNRLCSYMLEVK